MKTIKLGVFGLGRGSSYFKNIITHGGEIVAVCEKDVKKMEKAISKLPYTPACYTNFDEFIEHDMDAVFLANYFNEHTPFAIRCLERGIHVISECTSNATMSEGVALVRAAEKSKAIYMLAENYPFMKFNQEMRRVYREGTLGKAVYAEGEYNHAMNQDDEKVHLKYKPYPQHWRLFSSRTYYITHSLAPLMYITGARPKRVTSMPVFHPFTEYKYDGSHVGDIAAIITCLNDDESVFKVTGCAGFGAHSNSYRVCGTRGMIENQRGTDGTIMLRYNDWQIPDGKEEINCYQTEWPREYKKLIEESGHGGGDFFVMKEFFDCIREDRRPEFDVYFATTMASVGILAHRSMLEKGVPYDIPDFRLEEDRIKYENDHLSIFYSMNGEEPSLPCCSKPDYKPNEEQYRNYLELVSK